MTGANSGLGKAVAVGLGRLGARVLMACRSGIPEAGHEVARLAGTDAVEMLPVDLSDLPSVDRLADELASRGERVDLVVLNAGVVPNRTRRTAQGLELMFGVNFLANVALVERLLETGVVPNHAFAGKPSEGSTPRIVLVSSESHRTAAPLDFDNLEGFPEYGAMGSMKQYGHSKLLLSTYACELARRLAPEGEPEVAVHHLCPGAVNTNIARDAPDWVKPALGWVMGRWFRSPETAAEPLLYLCASREIEGQTGVYLHMETRKPAAENAEDPEAGRRLWQASRALLAQVRG